MQWGLSHELHPFPSTEAPQGHRHLRSTGSFMRSFNHPDNNTYTKNNIFHSHILLSCKLFLRYLDMEFMRNTCKNLHRQTLFILMHKITTERTSFQKTPIGTCQVCSMPKTSWGNALQTPHDACHPQNIPCFFPRADITLVVAFKCHQWLSKTLLSFPSKRRKNSQVWDKSS